MQRILSLAAALVIVLISHAYNLEDGQVWWGHYLDGMPTQTIGTGNTKIYNAAIFIPGDDSRLKDGSIYAVRFPLMSATQNIRNVKVWVSTKLPLSASADDADLATRTILNGRLGGRDDGTNFNEAQLNSPVKIPSEGVFVGVTFRVRAVTNDYERRPLVVSPLTTPSNGTCYYLNDDNQWEDKSDSFALALQVAVSSPNIPVYGVTPHHFTNVLTTTADSSVNISIPLLNSGATEIKSLDAHLIEDGLELSTRHFDFASFESFKTDTIRFKESSPSKNGSKLIALKVDKINGVSYDNIASDALGVIALLGQQGHRRTVMEEFTGTWCSWCPRGIAGMQLLSDKYGDDFIGIAIHRDNDPMVLSTYTYRSDNQSFPNSVINRVYETDPYSPDSKGGSYIDDIYEYCRDDRPCESDIEVAASYVDDNKDEIVIKTNTSFYFSTPIANEYAIALVVTEDSLNGETPIWAQANNYSGNKSYSNYPYLKQFVDAPGRVTDISYNHVPVAVKGIEDGINGSIPDSFDDGEELQFADTISISGNSLVQNKDYLNAIALLIYRPTGEIVNAAKTKVISNPSSTTQVVNVKSEISNPVEFYGIDGTVHKDLVHGVNILKYSDGTTRKVIIK